MTNEIKIDDIEFGDITIFAGHNATGKTKTILSLLGSKFRRGTCLQVMHGYLTDDESVLQYKEQIVRTLDNPEDFAVVYLENPEGKLYIRELMDIATAIMHAVDYGTKVVVETQSQDLFLALQVLISERTVNGKPIINVPLYWFAKENDKVVITRGDLDSAGTYGEWEADWSYCRMDWQMRYMKAYDHIVCGIES